MDDSTIVSLEAALTASPDNTKLRMILVQARLERDEVTLAGELLEDIEPATLESEERVVAGRVLRLSGRPQSALPYLEDESPPAMLERARALLQLDRRDEGRALYDRVIDSVPALEDVELQNALSSRSREVTVDGGGEPRRLRVISNDDTTQEELVRLLQPNEERVTFEDVGGLDALKKQIEKKIILPFKKPSLFKRFKKRIGGGILLYGPPGCGKTLLARATSGECNASFFNVAISDVLDMYIGESEQKLHALFEKARSSAPSVIFFDEIEALGGKRQYTREGTSSKLVSQFLAEMDGFSQNNEGVLILGATNVPWAVDPAFRRPGRFDRVVFVPPPDRAARARILELLLADRPTTGDLGLGTIAKRSSGFSGADLQNLVETATDEALEASIEVGDEVPISKIHLSTALGEVRATTLEWLTTARNYARYANESGQYDEVLHFLDRHGKSS